MATSQNFVDGNYGGVSASVAGRTCYRIKTCTCIGSTKRCEPLDICKRVRESAEMRSKVENETNLCNAKT